MWHTVLVFELLRRRLTSEKEITFPVRVHPGAPWTKVKGALADGTMKIDIAAAPEDGKANAELIAFLAEEFKVPRSHVEVLRGQTSKTKVVRITRH